jgi:hypothetical protein
MRNYNYSKLANELRNISNSYLKGKNKNTEKYYSLQTAANALDFVASLADGFSILSNSVLSVLMENDKFKKCVLEIAEDAITSSIRQDD